MLYATHADVRLDNIKKNLDGIRAHVGPERKILIAVKANGYGHGSVEISKMVERTGAADWLGVATTPEGVEIREAGVGLPILKLSHCIADDEIEAAFGAQMTLACVSLANAQQMASVAERMGVIGQVHMKLDTGMRRIGAQPDEIVEIARFVEECPVLHLGGAFTHMPVSDAPAQDEFSHAQIARFVAEVQTIEETIGRTLELAHCANSGAVLGQPGALLEDRDPSTVMVRPGIMIYGYYPDATTPRTIELFPGIEMKSAVTFVKDVPAGDTVGYGRTWKSNETRQIATIPVGYADGYSRLNSNRGRVLVNGRSYPVAGRVCMDQMLVDLGVDSGVKVGDAVTLIGRDGDEEITCDEVAEIMGTITYEVTCLLTPRVTRNYIQP